MVEAEAEGEGEEKGDVSNTQEKKMEEDPENNRKRSWEMMKTNMEARRG